MHVLTGKHHDAVTAALLVIMLLMAGTLAFPAWDTKPLRNWALNNPGHVDKPGQSNGPPPSQANDESNMNWLQKLTKQGRRG